MQVARKLLAPFPRLGKFLRTLRFRLKREPPITRSEITKDLIRECVGKENPTILEIGCNDGSHSLWFREIFESPKIYCFEPDPRAIERFRSKVGSQPNIELFEIALCDRDGTVEFFQSDGHSEFHDHGLTPQGWDLSGSIRKPKDHLSVHPWVTFDRKITVNASTLDTWRNEHNIGEVDFIWMDVQGAEMDVFRGAQNSLCRTRFIYTEYSNQELYEGQTNLRNMLRHLKDFEVVHRYANDVLLRNKKLG